MKKDEHITLNFSEAFLERLKAYARRHDMKINAVVKKAFEYLEDHQQTVLRNSGGETPQLWVAKEKADGWEP